MSNKYSKNIMRKQLKLLHLNNPQAVEDPSGWCFQTCLKNQKSKSNKIKKCTKRTLLKAKSQRINANQSSQSAEIYKVKLPKSHGKKIESLKQMSIFSLQKIIFSQTLSKIQPLLLYKEKEASMEMKTEEIML